MRCAWNSPAGSAGGPIQSPSGTTAAFSTTRSMIIRASAASCTGSRSRANARSEPTPRRLRFAFRRAAGDQLGEPVGRGDRDAVGDIAPRAVEQPLRHIILLAHRADLGTVGASHMPDDLDVLLVGFDRRDRNLAVEIQVG